jgi:hypothetical protein
MTGLGEGWKQDLIMAEENAIENLPIRKLLSLTT